MGQFITISKYIRVAEYLSIMSETVATSSSPAKVESETVDVMETAIELIAQGKRNVLCGEVPKAVNQFQEACQILAKKFGETAKECGDAYLCYGKSLLEMSRMESGVLGNALDGIADEEDKVEDPDTVTEEEREKISADVYDAMAEREEETKEKKTEKTEKMEPAEGTESEDVEEKVEGETEEENTEEEGTTEEEAEGEEEEEKVEGETSEKKEDEEEDVGNLQLAWEMLELAKIIFKRDSTKESKMKLAESHLKLGEVALETEQYDTAVGDLKECLKVQKEVLDEDDRCLAETFYQLGLAHSFAQQYEEAIVNYKDAARVIEAGEKEGKGKDIADMEDPVFKAHKEIKELKDILPDIMTKIEDVSEEMKNADKAKEMVKEAVGLAGVKNGTSTGFSDTTEASNGDVNVISHLVRKKRKNSEGENLDEKKAKLNGAGDAPNGTNGHTESNGTTSPEKIKTKTVEDVLASKEQATA